MENLSEKVYECTLAVEAHMVCDLLSQAGISARVEGEFLQTGGGELPLGNLVKVRVDPVRAAEAREVIADWEKLQPPAEPGAAPSTKTSRAGSLLWLLGGLMAGTALAFIAFESRYAGTNEYDRNRDGRIDARWHLAWDGHAVAYEEDNDFDGRFEWLYEVKDEQFSRGVLDADGDGRPERVSQFRHGVITGQDFYFASGGRIVKRERYEVGLLAAAELDDDGDGRFERRVSYDAHAEPRK
jgi:Putative prokaryotic signal transducing protein